MKTLFKTSILSNLLTVVMQIVFLYYISRHISLEIYGQYALILTLFSFVSLIFIAPLTNASQRFIHEYEQKEFYGLFNTIQLISLITASLVFLVVAYFGLKDIYSFSVVMISIVYILFSSLSSFYKSLDLQKLRNKSYLIGTFFDALSRFILPILFYVIFKSLLGMLIGLALGYFISFIVIYLRHEAKNISFELIFEKAKIKSILLYAFPFIVTSIGSWSISFSDRWFISYFFDSSYVGEYAVLAQFGGVLMVFGGIITTYLMPSVFNKAKESNNLAYNEFQNVFKYTLVFVILGTIVLLLLPNSVLQLFIGELIIRDNNYYVFISIYFGIIFLILSNIVSSMYMVYKKTNEMIYFWSIAALVNLCGNLFIESYGILAAGISTMLAYFTVFITSYLRLKVIVKNENY